MKNWSDIHETVTKYGSFMGHDGGKTGFAARIRTGTDGYVNIIASWADGWDHVSVTRAAIGDDRPVFWRTMARIKEMFFMDDEVVMQLHPAKKDYINVHSGCLHLWRPHDTEIPVPPKVMV